MKKKIFLLAASALTGSAMAQSNVTLYGSMDLGVSYATNVGGSHLLAVNHGTMQPDVWGLRGSEDLGGGMKATFQMENGFNPDTGTLGSATGALFNRTATVGLSTNFGEVKLGNMPDLTFQKVGPLSNAYLLRNWYLFNPGNLDNLANTYQYNNAVSYASPRFYGFDVAAMYGLGEVAGSIKQNRNFSLATSYANGPLKAAVSYSQENNRPGGFATGYFATIGLGSVATTGINQLNTLAVGAAYRIGPVGLNAVYTHNNVQLPSTELVQQNYQLGASWNMTPANALNLGLAHTNIKNNGSINANYNQISLGDVYTFSRRTQIYAQVAYQKASGTTAAGSNVAYQNGTAVNGGGGASSSNAQTVFSVGVHHSF